MTVRAGGETDLPGILAIYIGVHPNLDRGLCRRPSAAGRTAGTGLPGAGGRGRGGGGRFRQSFGDFRAWPGYRHRVEHGVHIRADCRGRGLGRALVSGLFPLAEALGKHVMIAGVDAENAASIALHERLGFDQVAQFREVGRQSGR